MRKNKYVRNEQKIQELLVEGRGTGRGTEYTPWMYVHEVPSVNQRPKLSTFQGPILSTFDAR